MMSSRAATRRGAARLLASGMKISAAPKPENPRAVPATSATAQIAIAVAVLTSAGMRPERLMLSREAISPGAECDRKTVFRFSASCAQRPAGLLADLGNDLRPDRVDLLIGHGLVARLNRHRDRDRLPGLVDALALVDVEHRDLGDQLLVHALRGAHDVAGLHGT